jgi:hypothetical protein
MESENLRIMNCRSQNKVSIFFRNFIFFEETLWCVHFIFSFKPWITCGMAQRPVRVVVKFWSSYSLKGLSDVFLFGGDHTNLRSLQVRICEKTVMTIYMYIQYIYILARACVCVCAASLRSYGLYVRGGPDYRGIRITEGEPRGIGKVKKLVTKAGVQLLKA